MDAQEKRVIRRKRHIVASTVEWTDELEEVLKERGMLSDGMNDVIQVRLLFILFHLLYGVCSCYSLVIEMDLYSGALIGVIVSVCECVCV